LEACSKGAATAAHRTTPSSSLTWGRVAYRSRRQRHAAWSGLPTSEAVSVAWSVLGQAGEILRSGGRREPLDRAGVRPAGYSAADGWRQRRRPWRPVALGIAARIRQHVREPPLRARRTGQRRALTPSAHQDRSSIRTMPAVSVSGYVARKKPSTSTLG